jgi:hypothetical protein
MRRKSPKRRYFLSQKQIREGRRMESVAHSRAKRAGRKLAGVHHYQCGCGCGIFTTDAEETQVSLPKQPKGQRKKNVVSEKQCIHFKGKAIL